MFRCVSTLTSPEDALIMSSSWTLSVQASQSSNSKRGPNLAVILGVLGGMAFTAVLVFVCVPLVRRRASRSKRTAGVQVSQRSDDVERQVLGLSFAGSGVPSRRKSSLMSYIGRWRRFGNLGSRRTQSSYDSVRVDEDEDLHRYDEKKRAGEKERGGALLPLILPEVSTFTWSDLRSKNTSADSSLVNTDDEDGLDIADTYSFPTAAATLSHNTSQRTQPSRQRELLHLPNTGTGQVGTSASASASHPHRTASSVQSIPVHAQAPPPPPRDPHTKRSLTPPGLASSKASSSVRPESYPDYVNPDVFSSTDDDAGRLGLELNPPRVSLPTSASTTYVDHLGIDMDPVKSAASSAHPHAQTKSHSGSLSRPGSLQLPSPPASPPQSPPHAGSGTSSSSRPQHVRSPSHARTVSISGSRPPLSSTRSAPVAITALPFRPTGSSSPANMPAWWSTTGAHYPSTLSPPQSPPRSSHSRSPSQSTSPHAVSTTTRSPAPIPSSGSTSQSQSHSSSPAPPLTQAFRSPLQRSPSQSTHVNENASLLASIESVAGGGSGLGRYPSLTVSPAGIDEPPRTRPSSTTGERLSRTPQGARPRPSPMDMLRHGSTASMSSPGSTVPTPGHDTDAERERKAYLRSSLSLPQTPKIEEGSRRREKGQSVALGYFDGRYSASTSHVASPDARAEPAEGVRALDYAPRPSGSSRRHSTATAPTQPHTLLSPSSVAAAASASSASLASSGQARLVRARDSPALRPLPASTLFYPTSPPTSPPLRPYTHSREGSTSSVGRAASLRRAEYAPGRSRSGSVVSLATVDEGRRERDRDWDREGGGGSGSGSGAGAERPEGLRRRESVSSRRSMLPHVERLPPMEFAEFEDEEGSV